MPLRFVVFLGGSKTLMESSTSKNPPLKSMKLYISIFSDKSPCMPLRFGIVERRCVRFAKTKGYPWSGLFLFHFL